MADNYGKRSDSSYDTSYGGDQQSTGNQTDSYGVGGQQGSYGSDQQGSYGSDQQGSYGSDQQGSYGSDKQGSYGSDQQGSYGAQQQQDSGYGSGQTQDNLGSDAGYGKQTGDSGYGTGGTEGAFSAPSYDTQGKSSESGYDDQSTQTGSGYNQGNQTGDDMGTTYDQSDNQETSGQKKHGGLLGKLEGAFGKGKKDNDLTSSD